jgi:chemotaxis protein MotB
MSRETSRRIIRKSTAAPASRASLLPASEEHQQRDRWLISYADLITLLFSLFVVLYAAADHERARAIAQAITQQLGGAHPISSAEAAGGAGVLPGAAALVEARAAVDRAFTASSKLRERARVIQTERGFMISLAEAGFFAPGEASVREDADELLDTLADALRGSRARLRVEGHTDATPIATARYPSNWELSSARASAVLARLVARGIAPARLAVAGYAGERPLGDNATPAGRALNRRVDLVVLPARE